MNKWKNMHERVHEYLAVRRSLGFKLTIEGKRLLKFAQFADEKGHTGVITEELAISWAQSARKNSDIAPARRIEILRALAKFCALFEPETEIPSLTICGVPHRRIPPYIYTDREIINIMKAAAKIQPNDGLRPATMQCLIGLLSATGIRISEALNMARTDVDLTENVITIRETKFRKSRYVPMHITTGKALEHYAVFRDKHMSCKRTAPNFFILDDGRSLNYRQALYSFHCIRKQLGLNTSEKRPPRLHDFRHTFACRRLIAWYKQGTDINKAILYLSVYLGHSKVTDTYWYITGIPSLMRIAAKRFEYMFGGGAHD